MAEMNERQLSRNLDTLRLQALAAIIAAIGETTGGREEDIRWAALCEIKEILCPRT